MQFVLVHGWGFDTRIWAPMMERLPGASVTAVDLGFTGETSKTAPDWPDDTILVGHSLGAMWLMKKVGGRCRGFVSIQGFDRFCPHVPQRRVAALKRGLTQDPVRTMQAFWRSCGIAEPHENPALNVPRLSQGLDWLMHWDAREAKKALRCPMLILAAEDDQIVAPAMTKAIWGDAFVLWSQEGGHILPLRHPDWCANHVLEFASTVSP